MDRHYIRDMIRQLDDTGAIFNATIGIVGLLVVVFLLATVYVYGR